MKKHTVCTLLTIFLLAFFMPVDVSAMRDSEYFNAHIKEIKQYYPSYKINNIKTVIDDKTKSYADTIDILKRLYASIDNYSIFYTKDELTRSIFEEQYYKDNKPVYYQIINKTLYIKVYNFDTGTSKMVAEALKVGDGYNITNVILDLRDNHGGEIIESINVAELFVKEGLIAKIDNFDDELTDVEYYSDLKELKYNLTVIVNEQTASAAELLAGAIKDSNSGNIIGSKTFGKAKVQKLIPIMTENAFIKNKALLEAPTIDVMKATQQGVYISSRELLGWAKITVGKFYTKSGKEIDGVGI